jgi:hypothetical protein
MIIIMLCILRYGKDVEEFNTLMNWLTILNFYLIIMISNTPLTCY